MNPAFFILALLYSALIIFLSSLSNLTSPDLGFKLSDKLLHFAEYTGFSFLWGMALRFAPPLRPSALVVFLISGLLFAASDEIHQSFVPGRDADVLDFLADTGGIATGMLCFSLCRRSLVFKQNHKGG